MIAHTRRNAYLILQESNLGSIQPGKLADLVALDRDYLTIPADQIKDIKPVMTMVGGRIVYELVDRDHTVVPGFGIRGLGFGILFVAAVCCGGSTTAPPATSVTLHGEVNDPVGDTLTDSRVPISPDLVHATADVAAGNITFVIQLASGTFDRQSTRVVVLLDTDQDGSTGIRQPNGLVADYGVDPEASVGQAIVTKADPVACAAGGPCFNTIGSASITFVPDGMQVTVPLSLLGNDDGRMSFQLNSNVFVAPMTAVGFDLMPDINLPPARIP